MTIPMLDLKGQYNKVKDEIDSAIQQVLDSTNFINGPEVSDFEKRLGEYLHVEHVIACANGTDELQIALMALNLQPGDEVIVPAFTYAATAEVVGLLGLTPVLVDVDKRTFNIKVADIEPSISEKSSAIVPVHLFGQGSDMEEIMSISRRHGLYVVEDNAQALGASYTHDDGRVEKLGTIGDIGTTSFFPTKNLGCYGDGGAMFTRSRRIAEKLKMITDHGQKKKYFHDIIGCNSRLDSIQAAVLSVKLKRLEEYSQRRYELAQIYKELLCGVEEIVLPYEASNSTHVYHQFTIRVKGRRDGLKEWLDKRGIASMIYYPMSLNRQKAFSSISKIRVPLDNSEALASEVLSLPIHTELTVDTQREIATAIKEFFGIR